MFFTIIVKIASQRKNFLKILCRQLCRKALGVDAAFEKPPGIFLLTFDIYCAIILVIMDIMFYVKSVLFGVGLAMDAFSVSLANGLNEPKMKKNKMLTVAGTFAFFQALMPLIGWLLVHTLLNLFSQLSVLIPWIALVILCFIGGKMIYDSRKSEGEEHHGVGFRALVIQGIATSIDALSVGLDIAEYNLLMAVVSALIIAVVTFFICLGGILIGKKAGTVLCSKASIFGGAIVIFIGLEIFITGVFF